MALNTQATGETVLAADLNDIKDHLEGAAGATLAWFLRTLASNDFIIRLSDNAGAQKLVIQDSDGTEVCSIDSDGLLTMNTLKVPVSASPAQTTAGHVVYDSTNDILTVGNGSGRTSMGSNGLKTSGGGYFLIPAGPGGGTVVASAASADTYGTWVEMTASTAAALYIVGLVVDVTGTVTEQQIDIGTGATPTSISEVRFALSASLETNGVAYFPVLIPVPVSTRIACRTADDSASALNHAISLICVNQSDVTPI